MKLNNEELRSELIKSEQVISDNLELLSMIHPVSNEVPTAEQWDRYNRQHDKLVDNIVKASRISDEYTLRIGALNRLSRGTALVVELDDCHNNLSHEGDRSELTVRTNKRIDLIHVIDDSGNIVTYHKKKKQVVSK